VNFTEKPPSTQWSALKYRGETIAEVWFKPDGEPLSLAFRVPVESFQVPGMGPLLTMENLLKAVGIATEEVESWRHEGDSNPGTCGPDSELKHPLSPPSTGVTHLNLHVRLKPPAPSGAPGEDHGAEVPEEKWQHLEARWNAILVLEATVDTLRMSMEAIRSQMETAARQTLTADEKVHALNADVAQWNKEKSRVHYVLPKAREFIHRATWATGSPERKKLGELFKNHVEPRVPFPEMDRVAGQLENLLKDRQVLSAQGVSVSQECKSVVATVQGALRTLQSNAAARRTQNRSETRARGKIL
jgi:hypothetical protein